MNGKLDPMTWLRAVADEFDRSPRLGAPADDPEGERYVILSDTLVRELAQGLRDAAQIIESPVLVRRQPSAQTLAPDVVVDEC